MNDPSAVTIASPSWRISESFGRYAIEVKRVLEERGIHANTIGPDAPDRRFSPTLVNIRIGYPTQYDIFGPFANVGTTISLSTWESTKLHEEWPVILNKASAVVVPCRWNLDVYRDNGVVAPLYYMPHGLSSHFRYVERPNRDLFRFLVIADRSQRKGFVEAMCSFVGAFGERSDVELVLKAARMPQESIIASIANPNIKVIIEEYTDAQMQELYASCDCMIFSTHAEGFGFPPREFAATGGIALATNYAGTADDIQQWGIPIHYELEPAWTLSDLHRGLGEWAMPDLDHLMSAMKAVRAMPYELRRALGEQFSRNVRSLYRWEDNATTLLQIIEEVSGRAVKTYDAA